VGATASAVIRNVNGNACTQTLKNCLQNTVACEGNGLKIR
jgi:hypothetical protein